MKSLSLILLFIVAVFSCHAQQYRPFPTRNAYWLYVVDNGEWPHPRYHYVQIMFDGKDTTINGDVYKTLVKRVYIDSILYQPTASNGWQYMNKALPIFTNKIANIPDTQVMAIREVNKQIMLVTFPSTTEIKVLDYNLAVGDSVRSHLYSTNIIVGSDSVLIGSSYHKRWITDAYKPYIVEGVGSAYAPFFLLNGQNTSILACYNHIGYGNYSQDSATCFYIHKYGTPASISDKNVRADVSVFPNPFADKIDIECSVPVDVTIYNGIGQRVIVDNCLSRKSISTNNLPHGVYFIELQNDAINFRKVERIVK